MSGSSGGTSHNWQRCLPQIQTAVDALHGGGVVAYPTEAVFGLGCDPRNEIALQRIIDIKGRDAHKGFILIASNQSQIFEYVEPVNTEQQRQLDENWPGPVTFVMQANENIRGTLLTGFRDTLAVRVSAHPVVIALCEHFGGALVSTSANRSGEPALRLGSEVDNTMGSKLDVIVKAAVGELASPTRIFELASGKKLR